jgi:hypothetical protein
MRSDGEYEFDLADVGGDSEAAVQWSRERTRNIMAASSKLMIEAERRFPVRIRIDVPLQGLSGRLDQMRAWLDENCGAGGWAMRC